MLMLATAALGATFVGMQAFEWTKLITEGVRPWGNPWGAAQFGSSFFMITGFHGTHVTIGVIFLLIMARKVWRGDFDSGRGASSPAGAASTRTSRSWASTGISSTWSGSSSSHFSIFGRSQTWQHATAIDEPRTAGTQPRRTRRASSIRSSSISWSGAGCSFSAPAPTWSTISTSRAICRWSLILIFMMLKAGSDRRHLHAHGLGAAGAGLRHHRAADAGSGVRQMMVFESDYTLLTRGMFFGG